MSGYFPVGYWGDDDSGGTVIINKLYFETPLNIVVDDSTFDVEIEIEVTS